MSSDVPQGLKDIMKILNDTAEFLKVTAHEMYNLSKSLEKVEIDFRKLKISDDDTKITSPVELPEKEQESSKSEPLKKLESLEPYHRIPSKLIKPKHIEEKEIKRPQEEDLFSVRDKITTLMSRLRDEVNIGTNLASEQISIKEKENLNTLRGEMTKLYNRFKNIVKEEEFYDMTPEERTKALKDMAEAIQILTEEYEKD